MPIAAELELRCRSRAEAAYLASQLTAPAAVEAVEWGIAQAHRRDLALAALCTSAAPLPNRLELARRRLREGPLHDALACVPALVTAGALERPLRARLDALVWEVAARGESDPTLTVWLNAQPEAVEELILSRARSTFSEQVRAANLLAIVADGLDESLGVTTITSLVNAATGWLSHREPLLWRVAARALGRLAHRTELARRAQRDRFGRAGERRRVVAAIAATPPASGGWAETELERAFQSDDPWLVAALAVAAPYLSRERPEMWQLVLEMDHALPVAWSVAHGLAMIGRRGGRRSLSASEQAAVDNVRQRLTRDPPRATTDAALSLAALTALDTLDGQAPPRELWFETHDDVIHRLASGGSATALEMPDLDAIFVGLDAPDESTRGHAHVVLRSVTRAHAAATAELVAALAGAPPPEPRIDRIEAEIPARLAAHVCEYGLRATLVDCAGDLVDAAPNSSRRGRAAAAAMRAVIDSAWHREHGASERDVRTFRKPLHDLIRRCAQDRPLAGMLAWWVLAGGRAATISALKLEDVTPAAAAVLGRLERAVGDAALGASADAWGESCRDALAELGAEDSALAFALRRVIEALALRDDEPVDVLSRLTTAIELFGSVMTDLDAAGVGDAAHAAGTQWSMPGHDAPVLRPPPDIDRALARWQRELSPQLFAVVAPVVRTLVQKVSAVDPPRRAGIRIGGFELIERLGGGGFGEVWKARRDGQLVALKLPLSGARADERALLTEALLGEAGRLAGISTAKVVTLIDRGSENGMPFLATSYLRGRTWFEHALATPTRMSLPLALRVAREACVGLANLHEMQIVHRDVTPRNIFLRFRGADPAPIPVLAADPAGRRIDEVVLIDLGISQRVGDIATTNLSFGYVAPEILDGSPVGPAADVYALAASLFHVLTGTRFAAALSRAEALRWHLETSPFDDPAVAVAASALPESVVELLVAATARDPSTRSTLDHVEQALSSLA